MKAVQGALWESNYHVHAIEFVHLWWLMLSTSSNTELSYVLMRMLYLRNKSGGLIVQKCFHVQPSRCTEMRDEAAGFQSSHLHSVGIWTENLVWGQLWSQWPSLCIWGRTFCSIGPWSIFQLILRHLSNSSPLEFHNAAIKTWMVQASNDLYILPL